MLIGFSLPRSIAQLLTSEMIYSSTDDHFAHVNALEYIVRLRGGLPEVGWDNEIFVIVTV
jgi:hypothetical protein